MGSLHSRRMPPSRSDSGLRRRPPPRRPRAGADRPGDAAADRRPGHADPAGRPPDPPDAGGRAGPGAARGRAAGPRRPPGRRPALHRQPERRPLPPEPPAPARRLDPLGAERPLLAPLAAGALRPLPPRPGLGLGRPGAWAAGVCWATSGYFLSQLNLYNLVAGVATVPFLVAACLRAVEERAPEEGERIPRRRWAAAAGLAWALVLVSGDPSSALAGALLAVGAAGGALAPGADRAAPPRPPGRRDRVRHPAGAAPDRRVPRGCCRPPTGGSGAWGRRA